MKRLKKDFQIISDQLKSILQKVEKMMSNIEIMEKGQGQINNKHSFLPLEKQDKGVKKKSATETVLKIIMRTKKGVTTAMIQKKTGYSSRKIWDIVHRAYRDGKIKKLDRGTYIKS